MTRIGAIAHTLLIAVLSLIGVALVCGGVWLIMVGGSWYYLAAGLAFVATAVLVVRRSPSALGLYAALVVGTLAWAIWEAGLDWWPLAARRRAASSIRATSVSSTGAASRSIRCAR